MGDSSELVPASMVVAGIESEPGLNGTYELCPARFQKSHVHWMKPGSRCYVRYYTTRGRWELYVSHHPAGTTYFYNETDTPTPPLKGWVRTEYVADTDVLDLSEGGTRVPAPPRPPPPPAAPFRLWYNRTCPYVQAVLIAVQEKGIEGLELSMVDVLGDKDPAFVKAYQATFATNRRSAVPLLEHEGTGIAESDVIVDYLDAAFGGAADGAATITTLKPPTPLAAARAAMFVKLHRDEIEPLVHQAMNAGTADAVVATCEAMHRAFAAVDAQLRSTGGALPYVCGGDFTTAECVTAPHLQRLVELVPRYRPEVLTHLRVPSVMAVLEGYPRLHAWAAAVLARPSVVATYHAEEVAAIKERAVAAWRGAPMVDTRQQAAAMLTDLFANRGPQ